MFENKVVVITGAGKGLGKEMANGFADQRATVVIIDVNKPNAAYTCDQINEFGGKADYYVGSVNNRSAITQIMDDIVAKYGHIDILVNNAGITRDRSFLKMSDEDWDTVMSVNLTSMFICTQEAALRMKDTGGGSIICVSSLSGTAGNFGQTNYSASKAGVIGFVKSLSKELPRYGIRINAIAPGFINTEMTAQIPKEVQSKLINEIPLKRSGEANEVASVTMFLASEGAGFINGQTININGGVYV